MLRRSGPPYQFLTKAGRATDSEWALRDVHVWAGGLSLLCLCLVSTGCGRSSTAPAKRGPTAEASLVGMNEAIKSNDLKAVEAMLGQDFSVDSVDNDGFSALHSAAFKRRTQIVNILLKRGANANLKGKAGLTPLHFAIWLCDGAEVLVRSLLEAGANVNVPVSPEPPVHFSRPRSEVFMHVWVNDWTPLHFAAFQGHGAIIRILVEAGADVDAAVPTTGATPLALALQEKHEEAARILRESSLSSDTR